MRDALIDIMEGLEGARWQEDSQLHLTLRFIGEAETPQANDLAEELGKVAGPAFELALSGMGHFERKGRPHTLWAGVSPSEELARLQRRLEMTCRRGGFDPETRKFAPHVTIARLSGGTAPIGPYLARHADLRSDPWLADAFILFESHLTPKGSIYEPVMRYSLDQEAS